MVAHNRSSRSTSALRVLLIAVQLLLAGCKSSEPAPAQQKAAMVEAARVPRPERQLVVFAAASLQDVFKTLGAEFEREHAVKVTFNFAGTQELRTQLEHGAPTDVFASADQKHMGELLTAGKVVSPVVFARNEPVIVVAKDSTAIVKELKDLPKLSRIVIGTPDVPIGRYTLQILTKASSTLGADFVTRVEANVVSREFNVRQVLAKVSLGEAQAGFVYRTDARTVGDKVSVVTIPAELNVIAEYPIAKVTAAEHPKLAGEWLHLVLSEHGQKALREAGFLVGQNASPTAGKP